MHRKRMSWQKKTNFWRLAWREIMFSYSGWFAFHMEPAGYVKMFVFVLLGYAIVTIFDFRRIRKIPMDEALKSAE